MALSSGKGTIQATPGLIRFASNAGYSSGKSGSAMNGLLDKLMGSTGTSEKPIEVKMTHDLAPLRDPVLKGTLVVIAGCLVLLLINQAIRK